MRIELCQLYPEHLSIYADRGNVQVLRRRCQWRGIELVERPLRLGEALDPEGPDLYLVGGGQDRDQALVAQDLLGRRDALLAAVESRAPVLAVCGGYQLLGHAYRDLAGEEIPGIGLLDLVTEAGTTRMIGNVMCRCDLGDGVVHTMVGFENHAGRTLLGPGVEPLGKVVHGHGNDGHSGFEGARNGLVLGTYVHGPLLPRNPWLADWLIARALERRGQPSELEPLEDGLELAAARSAGEAARRG